MSGDYTTITDPSAYFQTALYSGNGSTQSITNDGNSDLQPDWLWFKSRNSTQVHQLFDTSRGIAKSLRSNDNSGDNTDDPNDRLTAINSDGFSLGDDGNPNNGSNTYVCWQWKANGGTVANDTNGDITTSVQANQTAGFSIATYTGNGGSNQSLGHGLGGDPEFVIFKDRDSSSAWRVFFKETGASKFFNINTTAAENTSSNIFPSHGSTTISVEQNDVMNKNSSNHIMYSWRSIQGYSKFGRYTANNNADGPFIYTGFTPKMVVIKKATAVGEWHVLDTEREQDGNPIDKDLYWSGNYSEGGSAQYTDFLSNGFKLRNAHTGTNGENTSEEFMYMAWAEHPFVSSEGVPVTAR